MAAKKSSKTKSAAQVASQSAAAQRQASIERSAGIAAKVAPSLSTPTTSSSTKTTPSLNTPTVSSALPNGRTGEKLTINQQTNEIVGVGSGKIYGKGNSLAEALALQTQMQSGSAPTLTGRPDLFAVAPNADQKVESFKDPQTGTTVNPRTATADELAQHKAGTLINYPKSQGLTYLDGPTFSGLQKNLTEADLVRMPDGRIYLKQGLTIDAINARNAATPAGTTGNESITTEVPDTVDSDMLDEAMVDPQTEEDIQTIAEEQDRLQDEYLSTLNLSDEETAIRNQLADLHAEVAQYKESLQAGLDSIEDERIPMSFITGQKASLERRSQREMQIFADQESNLLERLGLAQEAREMKTMQAQAALQFFQDDIELKWKIQDRIQAQEDRVLERADKLEAKAQDTLGVFLEMFEGYDMSDLTPEAQAKMAALSASAGIPFDLVSQGLDAMKSRYIASNLGISEDAQLTPNQRLDSAMELVTNRKAKNLTEALAIIDAAMGTTSSSSSTGGTSGIVGSTSYDDWLDSMGDTTITQGIDAHQSYNIIDPVTGESRDTHGGYDIAGELGTAINSPVSGTVIKAVGDQKGTTTGWGNYVDMVDSAGNTWRFAHLDSVNVTQGQEVGVGDLLGGMGNTGYQLTSRGGDGYREPTASERAAGWATHLHVEAHNADGEIIDIKNVLTGEQETASGALSYEDFLGILGEETNQSVDPDSEYARNMYDEYVASAGGSSEEDTYDSSSDDYVLSLLTDTDRKKMLGYGLDPESAEDVRTYYAEHLTTSDEEEEDSLFGG
jgi:murein DD-endopeptidase MepM/ murein hydrolase activator NlpD